MTLPPQKPPVVVNSAAKGTSPVLPVTGTEISEGHTGLDVVIVGGTLPAPVGGATEVTLAAVRQALLPSLQAAYGQILLTTSAPSLIGGLVGRNSINVQNNGPNPISIGFSLALTFNTGHRIASGGSWSLEVTEAVTIYGIASVADQVDGAATNYSEIRK